MSQGGPVLTASTTHLSHISNILNCLLSVEKTAVITIDEDGLTFSAQKSHLVKCSLTLAKELFSTYTFNTDPGNYCHKIVCDVSVIIESFTLAINNDDNTVECTISYQGEGYPLVIIFEDRKITERCELQTFSDAVTDYDGLDVNPSDLCLEAICKGDVMHNALRDLKEINTAEVYIVSDAINNRFSFISNGEMGRSRLLLPSEKSILEKLELFDDERDISCFKFDTLDKIRKATRLASKVKFRKDRNGMMSISMLCPGSTNLPKSYTGVVIDFVLVETIDQEENLKDILDAVEDISTTTIKRRANEPTHSAKRQQIQSTVEDEGDVTIDVPLFF